MANFEVAVLVSIVFLQASFTLAEDKMPVPSEKDQAQAMELVKEVFGRDLTSRDAKVLARVAGDLLKQAGDPNNDAPMRYVLLLKAAESAAEAGDSTLALDAIAKLEEKFRANTGQIELKVLGKMASAARQPEEYAPVAEGYARLAVKALANDDFATANEAARHARTSAQRTRNVQAVQAMNELQRAVTDAERSFREVADAMRTLSANPDDPAANEVVGRHLAFTRGDWAAGLPHLVKAADKELVAAAQTDLNDPQETEAQVALGDAWYDVAQKLDNETAKSMVMVRAGTYYKKAMPQLGGMARARVERRVQEADAITDKAENQQTLAVNPKMLGTRRLNSAHVTISPSRPVRINNNLTANVEYHTNRNFAFGEIPDNLEGLSFSQTSHRSTGDIMIRATRPGIVYIAIWIGEGRPVLPNPWKPEPLLIPSIFHDGEWALFSHSFRRGEELNAPSYNRFGTIVIAEDIEIQ